MLIRLIDMQKNMLNRLILGAFLAIIRNLKRMSESRYRRMHGTIAYLARITSPNMAVDDADPTRRNRRL
jgi:hypothetical protein